MYSDEFLACYVHITIKYQEFRKIETKNKRAKAVSFYQYRPEIEALLKNGSTQKFIANRYETTEANLYNLVEKT